MIKWKPDNSKICLLILLCTDGPYFVYQGQEVLKGVYELTVLLHSSWTTACDVLVSDPKASCILKFESDAAYQGNILFTNSSDIVVSDIQTGNAGQYTCSVTCSSFSDMDAEITFALSVTAQNESLPGVEGVNDCKS